MPATAASGTTVWSPDQRRTTRQGLSTEVHLRAIAVCLFAYPEKVPDVHPLLALEHTHRQPLEPLQQTTQNTCTLEMACAKPSRHPSATAPMHVGCCVPPVACPCRGLSLTQYWRAQASYTVGMPTLLYWPVLTSHPLSVPTLLSSWMPPCGAPPLPELRATLAALSPGSAAALLRLPTGSRDDGGIDASSSPLPAGPAAASVSHLSISSCRRQEVQK